MSIEIQPELERRVQEGVQSGRFEKVNDLRRKPSMRFRKFPPRARAAGLVACPAVESVPGRLSGAWVFRGTRLPISTLFGNLEDGATIDEITDWLRISKDQVIAVLDFAARSVASPSHDAYSV